MRNQNNQTSKVHGLIRAWYWVQVWFHVIAGLVILLTLFPFSSQENKNKHIQNWSCRLLKIFGIQLMIKNQKILPLSPFMLSSNHISWVDIHAINAYMPIRFVAKSEVERWPIFGWMAKQLGTLFIRRNNLRHGKHVGGEIAKVLSAESVCIFPEGTSTEGDTVLTFKPNLFESAIIANVPVYSLAISYKSSLTNLQSKSAAFVGDMGLLESMSKILKDRNLVVELTFLPPAGSGSTAPRDRKWLALHSQEAIFNLLRGDRI
jgi:1-acyl-sn-glycerol-3-phosphate acyltransferase